jgi:hypothetical protein
MSIVLAKILLYENQPHMRRAHHTAHSTPRARRSAGHRLSIRPHGGMCRAGVLCGAEVKQVSRVHRRPPPRSRTRTRTPREPEPVRAQRPSRPRSASPSADRGRAVCSGQRAPVLVATEKRKQSLTRLTHALWCERVVQGPFF